MEEYTVKGNPKANPESIVSGQNYRFTVISNIVLRYEWSEDGVFEDRASTFAINRHVPKPDFRVQEDDYRLQIFTPSLHLTYNKQRFSAHGLYVAFNNKMKDWGSEWRYGDGPESNMGGTARTLDGVDGRCDMGAGIISRVGYAALDDSQSALFGEDGMLAPRKPGDRVDGYIFSYGEDFKGAMRAFYELSGPQPTIPRWALGNWWSRYYAYDANEYLGLMDAFERREVPLSVAVIDMDWHVVNGDEVPHSGWTGYTWNKSLFPEPAEFLKGLHDRDLKSTLNDHPHAGIHKHEDVYQEMAQALGHDTTRGAPILFDPTSPAFMKAYLTIAHGKREEEGCDFWWIDWQQGSFSRVPAVDPLWALNHLQFTHDALKDDRALIFSRYGGPGSHRYPVGFSGDSQATWASLEFQPEFTATASNIGYGWWSHDIGGHYGGSRDDELAVRWLQSGVFSPILRLHSCNSRWMSKEPWRYRMESQTAMRDAMQMRHRLVPYIYSAMVAGLQSSEPLIQPMYWTFPNREVAYRYPNQFYFGPSLVVNPVVTPRDKRTNLAKTQIWVPPGRHVDLMTGFVYDGDREISAYRSLGTLPVLAAEGSIVPFDEALVPQNGCKNPDGLEVLVVVGRNGQFTYVEDQRDDKDGSKEGSQRSVTITYDHEAGRLTTQSMGKSWRFHFVSLMERTATINAFMDGTPIEKAYICRGRLPDLPGVSIEVPSSVNKNGLLHIDLGPAPELSILDYTLSMSDLIEDFQIDNGVKDKIWSVVDSDRPVGVKMSQLLALGLEEAISGPLMELLGCDSRVWEDEHRAIQA